MTADWIPRSERLRLAQRIRREVADMNLLEIMAHLEQGGWSFKLRSQRKDGGFRTYVATVYGDDQYLGSTDQRAIDNPIAALTEAYVHCVCQRAARVRRKNPETSSAKFQAEKPQAVSPEARRPEPWRFSQ